MNRFIQLISRKPRTAPAAASPVSIPINREMFIDTEVPMPAAAPASPAPAKQPGAYVSWVKELANRDRFQEGYRAGYDFRDPETGRKLVERIKAEIRLALSEECDKLEGMIANLDRGLRRLGDEPDFSATIRDYQTQREDLERYRLTLEGQKLLVVGNDGFAELPVASFHAGFKQGYEKYLQEILFLNQYTR
ncbi:MAG: hypothetical protein IT230_09360 [Flavobacteriales bacterium]|nr:hypothetical protein [Flavobacteriales bacterium]